MASVGRWQTSPCSTAPAATCARRSACPGTPSRSPWGQASPESIRRSAGSSRRAACRAFRGSAARFGSAARSTRGTCDRSRRGNRRRLSTRRRSAAGRGRSRGSAPASPASDRGTTRSETDRVRRGHGTDMIPARTAEATGRRHSVDSPSCEGSVRPGCLRTRPAAPAPAREGRRDRSRPNDSRRAPARPRAPVQ